MIYKLPNQPKSKIIVRKKSRLFYQSKQKGTEKSHAKKSMIFDQHYWPQIRILFHKKSSLQDYITKTLALAQLSKSAIID